MKTISLAAVAALLFAGCVSSGARYDQSAIGKIKPGLTTEAQLESWFGLPFRHERLDGGRERIVWQYTKVGVGVGITEQHELLVTMNADGKVESFEERNK
jgi:outer membrane protein assembly factor BamE (lipoprotein component of BamABCDE complex)